MVIMNPPFGTSLNEDIFTSFFEQACLVTEGPIFLIHKRSIEKVD